MKMPNIQIDPARFYRTGKYIFFVGGIIGIIRLIDLWSKLEAYNIVGSIFSTAFQFLLFLFFSYLQGKEQIKELNEGDIFKMNEALDKLNLEDKDGEKR